MQQSEKWIKESDCWNRAMSWPLAVWINNLLDEVFHIVEHERSTAGSQQEESSTPAEKWMNGYDQ